MGKDKYAKTNEFYASMESMKSTSVCKKFDARYKKKIRTGIPFECCGCGCIEGELHRDGCLNEDCSCGRQYVYSELCHDGHPRMPFIQYPNVCIRCGEIDPVLFMVSDKEWRKYIAKRKRGDVICKRCYAFIKASIDKYNPSRD